MEFELVAKLSGIHMYEQIASSFTHQAVMFATKVCKLVGDFRLLNG